MKDLAASLTWRRRNFKPQAVGNGQRYSQKALKRSSNWPQQPPKADYIRAEESSGTKAARCARRENGWRSEQAYANFWSCVLAEWRQNPKSCDEASRLEGRSCPQEQNCMPTIPKAMVLIPCTVRPGMHCDSFKGKTLMSRRKEGEGVEGQLQLRWKGANLNHTL